MDDNMNLDNQLNNDNLIENDENTNTNFSDNIENGNSLENNKNLSNGYGNSLATSNRDAYLKGLNESYDDKIARNKANLNQARERANNPYKMKKGHENEERIVDENDPSKTNIKEKNSLDKIKDQANVLENKMALASNKIDSVRSKSYVATHPLEAAKLVAKKRIKAWLISSLIASFPTLLMIFVAIFAVLFIIGIFSFDSSSSSGECVTLPSISSICKSITVTGVGTMDVDEYIAGVINAEIGGMEDENLDMYKAGAIAARSYVLANASKDDSGNCVVGSSQSFQVYKDNPSSEMIQAAEETSGMVLVKDNAIYSTQYDAFCYDTKDSSNYNVCQGYNGTTPIPISWVDSHVPSTYRAAPHSYSHGNGMSQYGAYYLIIEEGKNYEEVLEHFYGDDGAVLASTNGSTSNCNNNFSTLSTYNLNHAGLKVLDHTLNSTEIAQLNSYIESEVNKAGYGTGAGVATAGQALIYWLEQNGLYLQYFWGGGHGGYGDSDSSFTGANPNWGKTGYANDYPINGPYYGMDCSGFVSWATRNACKANFNATSDAWMSYGSEISLENAKPGDVISWSTHIQLIVKNNGDGSVIVAEEAGAPTSGLVFTKIYSPGGKVVDMSNWYKNNCTS